MKKIIPLLFFVSVIALATGSYFKNGHIFSDVPSGKIVGTTTNGQLQDSGGVSITQGGTGQAVASEAFKALWPAINLGDLIYSNGSGYPLRLNIGSSGKVLTSSGGVPTWAAAVGGVTSINSDSTAAQVITGSNNISASTTGGTTTVNGTLLAPKAAPAFSTSLTCSYATASTVPYLDASKNLVSSSVTPTELGYVSGVTSSIQTQINSKGAAPSGTTGLHPKFTSSSAIGNSQWGDGTNGEYQFQNYTAAKGTAAAPLLDLKPGTGVGLYTDSSANLYGSVNGAAAFESDGNVFKMFSGGDTTNYVGFSYTDSEIIRQIAYGSNVDVFHTQCSSGKTVCTWFLGPTGVDLLEFQSQTNTATGNEHLTEIAQNGVANTHALTFTRRGHGFGTNSLPLNALTVVANADVTNVVGTTTVNGSTTITGSGTSFVMDFGIGDFISVSSAASTYARITAIASATSMTVDTALGNGSSQTMNKKQAIQSWQNSAGTVLAEIDPNGKVGCRSGVTCGTSTCNGTTEVTVTTASVGTGTIILLTEQATGGTPLGVTYVSSRSAGTSFGFKCAATDTSTIGWSLLEPR